MARERNTLDAHRRWVALRAMGETLEIGVGPWPTLRHYPAGVRVTGIDVSADAVARAGRALARARVAGAPAAAAASVRRADAMALPFADASLDTVAFSFSLCGVPDVTGALTEALRVLRPGGTLLMADHVLSESAPVRWLQRAVEAVTRRAGGEHFTRRPSVELRALPVEILAVERLGGRMLERVHARKPA